MPKHRLCMFCGEASTTKHHKEDVLPKWIAREFPDDVWNISNHDASRTYQTRGELGLTTRGPCTKCNNGWMSKLESMARPVLAPLMHGTPSELTKREQYIITLWFLKTCMVHEFLQPEKAPYFRDVERKALMQSLAIPPITWLFLGRYIGERTIMTSEMAMNLTVGEEANPKTTNGYSATFAIKQLALQVFTVHRPEGVKTDTFGFKMSRQWDTATVQIWPILGLARWPQSVYFDDEGFEVLAARWLSIRP